MKNLKALKAISFALVIAFALCACSFNPEVEETWEYKADDKKGAASLFNDFVEKTLNSTNLVVTVKNGENTFMVERIDGTSDHTTTSTTNVDTYSFIKDGEYYYAMTGSDVQYYMVGEENYNYGYAFYKNYLSFFDAIPDDADLTFSCEVKGSGKDGNSSAELVLEIKNGTDTLKINATAKNDLVETYTFSQTEDGQTSTLTLSFEYGSASITLPDITDWVASE